MKRNLRKILLTCALLAALAALAGCTSLVEEDPNEAQIPWATPADWEGQVPGMPGPGGF